MNFCFIISVLFFLISPLCKADIYERIDDDGHVSYSDSPIDDKYILIIQEPISTNMVGTESNIVQIISSESSQSLPIVSISTPSEMLKHIQEASSIHQVDPDLVHAVLHVESAYRQHSKSSKGAIGLMQLMPATAKRMGVRDIYNSAQNIEGGAKYLSKLLKLFNNDTRLALAAYNAGENSVLRHGNKIPPFRETQAYVPKVMQVYEALRKQRNK